MYIVTQLKNHCSDAEQMLYYCKSLDEASGVAQEIANESATATHILHLITTIYPDEPSIYMRYGTSSLTANF